MKHRLSLVIWLAFLLLGGATCADANAVPIEAGPMPIVGKTTYGLTRLAQATQTPTAAAATTRSQPATSRSETSRH